MRPAPICGLLFLAALLPAQTDTQPSLILRNEPEYSAEATRARVQSTVSLSIVIGEDGKAHDVRVAQGAGFGLDEKAIEAIGTWVFRPGTKEGHAAPMPANIEMNFHLQVRGDAEDRSGQFARLNFTLPPGASRPELIVGKLPVNPAATGDQALRFHLQVDAEGKPGSIRVLGSTDKIWEQQALRAIQSWRFRPALLDGAAIPADGIFELAHSAPDEPEPGIIERPIVKQQNSDKVPRPLPRPIEIAGLIARVNHTATRLNNGTVLIAGGALSSAQTFDPITRAIVNTGNMLQARQNHTATLLKDGTVLIAGGEANGRPLAEAEIFDPSTGKFFPAGGMHEPRSSHTAALLPDGRVLICGGIENRAKSASAEIYDPRTKSFLPAGRMKYARASILSVSLKDGRVLIVSAGNVPAEIFNPATGAFTSASNMATPLGAFIATLLESGQVLIAADAGGQIFDPATNSFHPTVAPPLSAPVSVLLGNGKVLITGSGTPQTEIYDPASGAFVAGPPLLHLYAAHTATLLEDGSVLVAGGNSAELLPAGLTR